jgi:2,4-dienoyl-CoA reductase-like NADH-dependent reductase (Old Yellow Enzyme family)
MNFLYHLVSNFFIYKFAILGGWQVFSSTDKPYSQRYPSPQRLTIEQIDTIVEAFTSSAARAVQAGFDFVEINAGEF